MALMNDYAFTFGIKYSSCVLTYVCTFLMLGRVSSSNNSRFLFSGNYTYPLVMRDCVLICIYIYCIYIYIQIRVL